MTAISLEKAGKARNKPKIKELRRLRRLLACGSIPVVFELRFDGVS
jgi:hypothetical protein